MNVDIYDKAQSLADAIGASSELHNLRETEQAMLADDEAQKIIVEFQDMQSRMSEAQQKGEELTEEAKSAVATIEETVESHPLISAYLAAQDQFTEMLDSVNAILASTISGESSSDEADGCDSCGTGGCSGCHS
ncbi:MAG: YlbF family regulator [Desulfitobacteriaceae bacterium]